MVLEAIQLNITHKEQELTEQSRVVQETLELFHKTENQLVELEDQKTTMENTITFLKQKITVCQNLEFLSEKDQPDPADLELLAKKISPKSIKIEQELTVHFTEGLHNRKVTLHYQKSLKNGKRPDFILEIQTDNNKIHLVMDAKFKNYLYQKNVVKDLEIIKKKYATPKYYVFVVHPCTDPKFSNLGSKAIYFSEDIPTMPFHHYGYLLAQPNFIDNLKKAIGMALEYLIEGSYNAKQKNSTLDPKPKEEKLFCLNCGTNHTELVPYTRPGLPERYHYTNTCQNSECGHVAYFDYCWNCKTKLYKHGSYWDYHRTSVWSAFDIHCPNCGLTVADNFKM